MLPLLTGVHAVENLKYYVSTNRLLMHIKTLSYPCFTDQIQVTEMEPSTSISVTITK